MEILLKIVKCFKCVWWNYARSGAAEQFFTPVVLLLLALPWYMFIGWTAAALSIAVTVSVEAGFMFFMDEPEREHLAYPRHDDAYDRFGTKTVCTVNQFFHM